MKFLANRKNFIKSCLQKPVQVLLFIVVMCLFCGFVLLVAEAGFIAQRTEKTLEKERQKLSKQNAIPFSRVSPHTSL
jgi:Na+-transporting NADH:ubiquinone oxidoreductase subunit NqrC